MRVTLNWICSFKGDPPQMFFFHLKPCLFIWHKWCWAVLLWVEHKSVKRYRRCFGPSEFAPQAGVNSKQSLGLGLVFFFSSPLAKCGFYVLITALRWELGKVLFWNNCMDNILVNRGRSMWASTHLGGCSQFMRALTQAVLGKPQQPWLE